MKSAICQVADTGPLESLVVMLRSVGYRCCLPNEKLRSSLRDAGCEMVLEINRLVSGMGYDYPFDMPYAELEDMESADLYVDVKGHRNAVKIRNRWPNLEKKILYYRINGGEPEHVVKGDVDYGDEVNLPCPILTPNQWYRESGPWDHLAYTCWPPFYRFDEYALERTGSSSPVCLIHNLVGWGYGALVDNLRNMGVRMYGDRSPDGLIQHSDIPEVLSTAVAMVHLKSSDSPGYSLYEALSAACPLIVPRRLIWRSHMEELFVPGETCLVFDRPTHDALSLEDVNRCTSEVRGCLEQLSDPNENRRIGTNGQRRLKELMWSDSKEVDVASLRRFMRDCF